MFSLLLAIIYISFISLGLPDSLLGSAWPSMYSQFGVPVSWAGIISMIISAGTIVSSLQSEKMTRRLGAGKVTAFSVALTAAAILGFSMSGSFWMLCLWAIPYGLGAGGVDAALNNYVALNYSSRHMSWLHCMWGVGCSVGPWIMGQALSGTGKWNTGYLIISILQIVLSVILFLSLPLWKKTADETTEEVQTEPLKLSRTIRLPGAWAAMLTFFCYCSLEQTAGLWASSYLVLDKGVSAETAASFAAMFFIGITIGRALSGFLTMKLSDQQMIRLGQALIGAGILCLLAGSNAAALGGLILVGLGCAPVYPCMIHSTPAHFGADRSQAVIGVQMASAYVGTCIMPPLFGLLADWIGVWLFPVYLLFILVIMVFAQEQLSRITGVRKTGNAETGKEPVVSPAQ